MGRLPNLSDQGPRKRLTMAGTVLSSIELIIVMVEAYS